MTADSLKYSVVILKCNKLLTMRFNTKTPYNTVLKILYKAVNSNVID